jgi:pimeloyl-ACP methyl ester carboxylesterase
MQPDFTVETSSGGVVDRSFTIGEIPGVLWSPASPAPDAPLLLMGHGGGLHKRAPGLVARARKAVLRDGFHVAAIDAPGHGERSLSQQDQEWVDALIRTREQGGSLAPIIAPFNGSLAERAVPEWQATIDALLGELGADAPIGYSGMTLASAIGISLVVAEPRIRAAIFGGVFVYDALLAAARKVTIPIEFLLPWNDDEIDRSSGLELFDAFGSTDKTLHAFPGSHFHVPAERIDTRFFARQLSVSVAALLCHDLTGQHTSVVCARRSSSSPVGW